MDQQAEPSSSVENDPLHDIGGTDLTQPPPSIETVIGHAAVIPGGAISPLRSAHVRPVIVIVPSPPRGRIPPSAVVIMIPSVPEPIAVEMTAAKGKMPKARS